MKEFKNSAEALKALYTAKMELRTARGYRKRDLTKYVNRLRRVYEDMRKEEADNASKKTEGVQDR